LAEDADLSTFNRVTWLMMFTMSEENKEQN